MAPTSGSANAIHRPPASGKGLTLLKVDCKPELLLQQRRRTLQTISELSPQHAVSPDWHFSSTSGPGRNSANAHAPSANRPNGTSKSNRRRSLPQQGTLIDKVAEKQQQQPSITVTSVEPPSVRRSWTAPLERGSRDLKRMSNGSSSSHRKSSSSNEAKRLSSSSVRKRHSQKPSLCEEEVPRDLNVPQPQPMNHAYPTISKTPPMDPAQNVLDRSMSYAGGGWNARRERERIRREQAAIDARIRREREGRGISVGSSSTLPSMSPFPSQSPKPTFLRASGAHQHMIERSRSMGGMRSPDYMYRTSSWNNKDHSRNYSVDVRMLTRTHTHSGGGGGEGGGGGGGGGGTLPPNSFVDPISRPHSTSSAISRVSQMTIADQQRGRNLKSPPPRSFSSPIPPDQYPGKQDRSSSSQQGGATPNSTRNSSAHSLVSGVYTPNTIPGSNRSSTSRQGRSTSLRRQKPGGASASAIGGNGGAGMPTKEQLDTLAALTGQSQPPPDATTMTPESLNFLETHQAQLDSHLKRASSTSDTPTRWSQIQTRACERSRSRPRASGNPSQPSQPSNNIIIDENPDKRGSAGNQNESVRLLREREKLVRWKAEREKAEFEGRERAKVRERVRRANELEEKRERELSGEKGGRKGRWSCGLFGKKKKA